MAEASTGSAEVQGTAGEDAQGASDTQAQGAAGPVQGTTGEAGTATVEALTAKLRDLEKDNLSYRKREAAREKAEREKAEGEMTEVERLRAENERLNADLQERERRERQQTLRLTAVQEAGKLGYRDPDLAFDLLQAHVADVEWGKDGQPTNVAKLLTEYAKARPFLVTTTDFGGGSRGQSATSGTPDMNTLIRGAASAKQGR